MRALISWLGHRLREVGVYFQYIQKARRRPVIFVSVADSVSGFSSELRGKNPVRLWRSQGINAIVVPPQLEIAQRRRLAAWLKPDVVVHQTFRIEGNDPSLYPQAVNILDLDDADFLDPNIQERMKTRLTLCDGGIAGSRYTEAWIKTHIDRSAVVWTGSTPPQSYSVHEVSPRPQATRSQAIGNSIVWAITSPLDNPLEAEFLKSVLARCAKDMDFQFIVIGRGDTEKIKAYFATALAQEKIIHHSFLPYADLLAVLRTASVGLAPLFEQENSFNKGKSFGKILAYLTAGIPVITTYAADHELFFEDGVNGFIANDTQHWVDSIKLMLSDEVLNKSIREQSKADYQARLSLEAFSSRALDFIEECYQLKRGSELLAIK